MGSQQQLKLIIAQNHLLDGIWNYFDGIKL